VDVVSRDLAGARAAHAALIAALATLTDEQARSASKLPDWTVGHVLAHIARNADSHARVLRAAAAGEPAVQYPGGKEQRAQEIEDGAGRPAAELVDDIVAAGAGLDRAWAATPDHVWQMEGQMAVGPVRLEDLPFRRWRETVVHHADLGLAYTHRDWPADYVRLETQRATMLWNSRRSMGLTTLPAEVLALDDHDRLAWLLGRLEVSGVEPAGIF